MKRIIILLIITLVFSVLSGCGSSEKESGVDAVNLAAATYVGSDRCANCHNNIYSAFVRSGHPYKYTHTGGADPGTYTQQGLLTRPLILSTWLDTATLDDRLVSDATGSLDWSVINYTVGGFGWKIRWGVKDNLWTSGTNSTGYIWTGLKAQFNLWGVNESGAFAKWSNYNETKDKKYECAICHNTNGIVSTAGYDCFTDGGTDAAPARPQPWQKNPGMGPDTHGGYYSSWTFDGVQCEECHGPASAHVDSPYRSGSIVKNKTILGGVEVCAKCHIRAENTPKTGAVSNAECGGDSNSAYLTNGAKATGAFIGHHEQYNEMVGYNGDGVHATLTCTTCHDPHKRAIKVVEAVRSSLGITDNHLSASVRGAIKVSCQSCHPGKDQGTADMHNKHRIRNVTCVDCHMAEATKSAMGSATSSTWGGLKGDLKTHIFKINPAGTTILRKNAHNIDIATNYITPAYACGKCHDSTIYNVNKTHGDIATGPTSSLEAATAATGYHSAP